MYFDSRSSQPENRHLSRTIWIIRPAICAMVVISILFSTNMELMNPQIPHFITILSLISLWLRYYALDDAAYSSGCLITQYFISWAKIDRTQSHTTIHLLMYTKKLTFGCGWSPLWWAAVAVYALLHAPANMVFVRF